MLIILCSKDGGKGIKPSVHEIHGAHSGHEAFRGSSGKGRLMVNQSLAECNSGGHQILASVGSFEVLLHDCFSRVKSR